MPNNLSFMKYPLKSVPALADVGVPHGDGDGHNSGPRVRIKKDHPPRWSVWKTEGVTWVKGHLKANLAVRQGAIRLFQCRFTIATYSTCVAHTTLVSHHGLANIGICSPEELINFPIRMRCAVKMKKANYDACCTEKPNFFAGIYIEQSSWATPPPFFLLLLPHVTKTSSAVSSHPSIHYDMAHDMLNITLTHWNAFKFWSLQLHWFSHIVLNGKQTFNHGQILE